MSGEALHKGGVTFRSICIGLTLIPFNMLWVVLAEMGWYSGFPTCLSLFYNAIACLFALVCLNVFLSRLRPGWALEPAELLVIHMMVCIASGLAGHDTLQLLVPIISHLHRYQPIHNLYGELMPYVPEWLVVTDSTALQGVYEGQDSVYRWVNIRAWLGPLTWWGLFMTALCTVMWGLDLVFRKQWVESEKLAYPILQVPWRLAVEPASLFTSKPFWCAFSVVAIIDTLNGLHVLYPAIPAIPIVSIMDLRDFFTERPWRDVGNVIVSFYPFAIGLFFLMPLDLIFSCWFFFFFFKAERVLASQYGWQIPGAPFIDEQMGGAFYAIALTALWMTRRHIMEVVRLALGFRAMEDNPAGRGEARLALCLMGGGLAFLMWFCLRAGMTAWMAALFLLLFYLLSIAITRIRVELGPPVHDLHSNGPNIQIVKALGMVSMRARNPRDLVMFAMMNFFNRVYRGHPMPHGMEAFRAAYLLKLDPMRWLVAMFVATVAGVAFSFWALLWMYYHYGGAAEIVAGDGFGWEIWLRANGWFTAPEPHRLHAPMAVLIGLCASLGLGALRMSLTWWPLHPVAFALAGTWSMDRLWMCAFLAWLIKLLLLRYGGAKAYRPAVPFFMGLILADFLMGGFWNLLGIVMESKAYRFWF